MHSELQVIIPDTLNSFMDVLKLYILPTDFQLSESECVIACDEVCRPIRVPGEDSEAISHSVLSRVY